MCIRDSKHVAKIETKNSTPDECTNHGDTTMKTINTKTTTSTPVEKVDKYGGVTATENREIILKATERFDLPFQALEGNTFAVRGLIWANGGKWDKEAKKWLVPVQVHEEVQKIVTEITVKVEKAKEAHKAKKLAAA